MTYFLLPVAIAALFYQLIAFFAGLRHLLFRESQAAGKLQPVSILKPVHGLDPHFYDAIRSHAAQDYPEFEILFGVSDPEDPAVPEIQRLQREFPDLSIHLVFSTTPAMNRKVGVLIDLAACARHPLLVVSDSDIEVKPDYLRRVVAPLDSPEVGVVTCLYRACADSLPSRWEALGIATDFAPSVLVAPLFGVRDFGLGATLAFRDAQLRQSGGFEALADYIADDYQLAKHLTSLGTRAQISRVVVDTHLGDDTWAGVWRHQIRWGRTIRVSRGGGYAGLPVTHAGLWAILVALSGNWHLAIPLLAARLLSGLTTGVALLHSPVTARYFFLIPLWDLWAFCVWTASLCGNIVTWRGGRMRLCRDGRITPA